MRQRWDGCLYWAPIKGALSQRLWGPKKGMFIQWLAMSWAGTKKEKPGCSNWPPTTKKGRKKKKQNRAAENVPQFSPFRGGLGRASCTFRTSGYEISSDDGCNRLFAFRLWQSTDMKRKSESEFMKSFKYVKPKSLTHLWVRSSSFGSPFSYQENMTIFYILHTAFSLLRNLYIL